MGAPVAGGAGGAALRAGGERRRRAARAAGRPAAGRGPRPDRADDLRARLPHLGRPLPARRAGGRGGAGAAASRWPAQRDVAAFDALSARAYAAPGDAALARRWMDAQGPDAPGLVAHLRERGRGYDAVAFVTYLYRTTADAIGVVRRPRPAGADAARRAAGAAGDLPGRLRRRPRPGLLHRGGARAGARALRRGRRPRPRGRLGARRPAPGRTPRAWPSLGVDRPYALCVGRVDLSKGVGELVEHHARYRRAVPDGLDLVLAGGGDAPLPVPPLAAPAGLRRGRRRARRAGRGRRRWWCRRPTRACRWCSSRPGATAGRPWPTPPRRCWWASRAARAAGSGTATATSTPPCSTCWPRARPLAHAIGRQGAPLRGGDLPLGPRPGDVARRARAGRRPARGAGRARGLMGAVLSIYGLGLLLCLVAGVALAGAARPPRALGGPGDPPPGALRAGDAALPARRR